MLTDEEIEALTHELQQIYQNMETQLVQDVSERFKTYDDVGGTLKWESRKLDELGVLNRKTVNTIAKASKKSRKEIIAMLKAAQFANMDEKALSDAHEAGAIAMSLDELKRQPEIENVLNQQYLEIVNNTVKMIETKAEESVKSAYMTILNQAYLEVSSGTYSYNEAIVRGLKKMAEAGFDGATYKNELTGKIRHMSIEAVVRRDAISACNRVANDTLIAAADKFKNNYVEVSSHLGARIGDGGQDHTNHAWWQGKVYAIDGEGTEEANEAVGYPIRNLVEVTGYGLVDGLGGANCRHRMFIFIPGISKSHATQYDYEENKKIYLNTQKLRQLERAERNWKRDKIALSALPDSDEKEKSIQTANKKISEYQDKIIAFTKKTGLRRQFEREMITEDYK